MYFLNDEVMVEMEYIGENITCSGQDVRVTKLNLSFLNISVPWQMVRWKYLKVLLDFFRSQGIILGAK